MNEAAELFIKVTGDVSDAMQAMGQVESEAKSMSAEVGQQSAGFSKFGDVAKGAVMGVGMAFGNMAAGMVMNAPMEVLSRLGSAIDLASDKAESASKAQVIFGDSYGIIEKASEGAANSVMMSSGKYLEAAGNVGNLVTNFGFAGDEAANMSKDIIKLGADMGSFNNADPTEVIDAIGAAFRGETEPIRRFGVSLNQTAIDQKAVQMGLAGSTQAIGKMDFATQTHIRTQAAYQMILEQTSNAQGDVERTSTGFANSQRIAAAKQEEAWTRLGEVIKPFAQVVMTGLAEAGTAVVNMITDVITGIQDWVTANKPLVDAISGFASGALAMLVSGLGTLFDIGKKVIDVVLGPMAPVTAALGTVFAVSLIPNIIAAGVAFGTNLMGKATELITTFTGPLKAALDASVTGFQTLGKWAQSAAGFIGDAAQAIGDKIGPMLSSAWDAAKRAAQPVIEAAGAAAAAAYEGATKIGSAISDAVSGAWDAVKSGASRLIAPIGAAAGAVYAGAVSVGEKIGDAVSGAWNALMSNQTIAKAVGLAGSAAGAVYGGAVAVVEKLVEIVGGAWSGLTTNSTVGEKAFAAGAANGGEYAAGTASTIGAAKGGLQDLAGPATEAAGIGLGGIFGIALVAAASIPILDWIDKHFGQTPEQAKANAEAAVKPMADELTIFAAAQQAGFADAGDAAYKAFADTFRAGMAGIPLDDTAAWDALTQKAADAARAAGGVSATEWSDYFASSAYQSFRNDERLPLVGAQAVQTVGQGATEEAANSQDMERAAHAMSEHFDEAAQSWYDSMYAIGAKVPQDIATGIIDTGKDVMDAGDRLIELLKNGLSPAEEAAKLEGEKYTKAVAQGIKSEIPGAKEAAQNMAVQAIATIEKAANGTPNTKGLNAIGKYYDSLLASGMDDASISVALKAAGVSDDVIAKLTGQSGDYTNVGETYSSHLATGITNKAGAIDTAVNKATDPLTDQPVEKWGDDLGDSWMDALAAGIRGGKATLQSAIRKATAAMGPTGSPPHDPESPVHDADKWGKDTGEAWMDAMGGGIRGKRKFIDDQIDNSVGEALRAWQRKAAINLGDDVSRIHVVGGNHVGHPRRAGNNDNNDSGRGNHPGGNTGGGDSMTVTVKHDITPAFAAALKKANIDAKELAELIAEADKELAFNLKQQRARGK